jgi:ABC-2 type transport system permease protein
MSTAGIFGALLRRDLRVARRELPQFLVRTTMQPFMFIIVFGYLLPKMGFVQGNYGSALLPGIIAVSLAFSSVQSVALPLVQEFGWTKEIEDRLMAPVSIRLVAFEKIVSASIQGVFAALFVLPVARLIMGPIVGLTASHFGEVILITVLGAAAFSVFGLMLGTMIEAQNIGLMFSIIVAPMIFFGCAYYPWVGLKVVPIVQYAVLINPLVYVAEGMRGALTPEMPHMPMGVVVIALFIVIAVFWTIGYRSFERRAVS